MVRTQWELNVEIVRGKLHLPLCLRTTSQTLATVCTMFNYIHLKNSLKKWKFSFPAFSSCSKLSYHRHNPQSDSSINPHQLRHRLFQWHFLCSVPASWSGGQSFWLLTTRSRVRFFSSIFPCRGRIPAVTMVWVVSRIRLKVETSVTRSHNSINSDWIHDRDLLAGGDLTTRDSQHISS